MKDRSFPIIRLLLFCFLFSNVTVFAQRDTLRLFYKGLQTELVDSNYNKISDWAKKLNGKRHTVEIISYYDFSDYKKGMIERAENVQMIVIRKARDFTNIISIGAIKGNNFQRAMVDIVYSPEGVTPDRTPAPVGVKKEPKAAKPAPKQQPKSVEISSPDTKKEGIEEKQDESTIKTSKVANAPEIANPKSRLVLTDDKYNYYIDSTYKNGELKLVKRKEKKK